MTIPNLLKAPLGAPAPLGMRNNVPKTGGAAATPRYGMTMWFQVVVTSPEGHKDLGQWSGCSGLGVRLDTRELRAGGEYQTPYLLPEEISYSPVTLERAMDHDSAAQVRGWLENVASKWIGSTEGGAGMVTSPPGGTKRGNSGFQGTAVTITLFTALPTKATREVASWVLRSAIPTAWQGPTLSAKNGDVAIERLTLVHRGFLDADSGTSPEPGHMNRQGQGKLQLSTTDPAKPKETLAFQYNPASLTEELEASDSKDSGRTLQNSRSGQESYGRKKISFGDLHIEGVKKVKEVYDQLWKWAEPTTEVDKTTGKAKLSKLPALRLQLGSGAAGVVIDEHVAIKRITLVYLRFTSAGVPSRARLNLDVTVLTKEDLRSAGKSSRS